ncbi:unnamed protein product [Amoebophrya sp. A120]|nr:unnamed protein product [Amoebophrya sp. A120]|eukprot:GSA120T00005608001.1
MASASSASSSSAPVAAAGNAVEPPVSQRPPTFSDLLLQGKKHHGKGKKYDEWIGAAKEVYEKDFSKHVVGAMVGALQFATYRRHTAPKRLPNEIVGIVREFVGPLDERFVDSGSKKTLEDISDTRRARDLIAATEYFVNLAKNAAQEGGGSFKITPEIRDAAPKCGDGSAVPMPQILALLERKEYAITNRHEEIFNAATEDRFRLNDEAFPITIEFNDPNNDVFILYMRDLAAKLESSGEKPLEEARLIAVSHTSDFMREFSMTLGETQQKVLSYIKGLVMSAIRNGDSEFLLTEEIYDQAPRLGNGKRCPFFRRDARALSLTLDHYPVHWMITLLNDTRGFHVRPGRNADGFDDFPVRIVLVDA